MAGHEFRGEERPPVRFVEGEAHAWALQRHREAHDVAHVLAGLPPSVPGELVLKVIEFRQTGLPVAAFSAAFGPLRAGSLTMAALLAARAYPWGARVGAQAVPAAAMPLEELLHTPLADVRRDYGWPRGGAPKDLFEA